MWNSGMAVQVGCGSEELPIDDDCHGRWFPLCGQYSIQTTRIQFEHLSIEKDNGAQKHELLGELCSDKLDTPW
jgi:hypothetical protein